MKQVSLITGSHMKYTDFHIRINEEIKRQRKLGNTIITIKFFLISKQYEAVLAKIIYEEKIVDKKGIVPILKRALSRLYKFVNHKKCNLRIRNILRNPWRHHNE